ncbi:MAG TPA: hypothetical protein VM684_10450, partial [Gaiellales bacterium]|nr:hypothetical protein [Gaiellales bacterium]
MRAISTKPGAQALPTGAARLAGSSVAVAGATALWTALVILLHARSGDLSGSGRAAVIFGIPALLAAGLIFDSRVAAITPLRYAAAWAALVVAASIAADRLSAGHVTLLLGVPAIVICAVVFGRRPAAGIILALAMSGFYGSLIAFWHYPEEKTVQLVLGGLTLALIWHALVIGRDYSIRPTLGLAFTLLFAYVSIVQLVLDQNHAVAGRGFMSSTWFMLAVPVIALAGWPQSVLEKIAKGVVAVAGLVGLYSLYRWIFGISVSEYQAWGADIYNYVGGKLRLIGPFPNGQDLGGWTSCMVPFCLAMAFTFHGRWRVVSLVSAALCLLALAGSQLRIAVVAVAVAALVVVLMHEGSRGFAGLRLGATVTALLVMVAIGIAAFQITG